MYEIWRRRWNGCYFVKLNVVVKVVEAGYLEKRVTVTVVDDE